MKKEMALQIACVRWFSLQYPQIVFHHSPNEGVRSKISAVYEKRMGLRAGFPDLFIALPVAPYGGLFVEFKAEKGRVSPAQKETLADLSAAGYKCEICRSFDDFRACVESYLVPLLPL